MGNNEQNNTRAIIVKIPKLEKKTKLQKILDIGNLVVLFATIASLILNYCTLREMQAERNNAYRPNIQFNSIEYVFQIFDSMELLPEVADCPIYRADENGHADYNFTLNLEARNIGVGTAKDVKITISEESSFAAISEFNEMSEYCDMEYNKGPHGYSLKFSDGTYATCIWLDNEIEIPYILPNAESMCIYQLPSVYYCLIHAMQIELRETWDDPFDPHVMVPDIEIIIEYSDVQGVIYREKAYIHTEPGWAFGGGRSLVASIISEDKAKETSNKTSEGTTHDTPDTETAPPTTIEAFD